MANIYDIAKAADVSAATVSLILNRRGDELRISQKTQEKVFRVAKELNYVPNVNARKLLSGNRENIPEIGLLWSTVQNEKFLNSMIYKLNELVMKSKVREMNVTIYPFINGHIEKMEKLLLGNYVHGLIIPVGDDRDMEYLEKLNITLPVVCLYREADRYHAVNTNDKRNGEIAAEIFHNRKIREAGLLNGLYDSTSSNRRFEGFRKRCDELGVKITVEADAGKGEFHMAHQKDPYTAGYLFAEKLIREKRVPAGIFAQNDASTRGAVAAFQKNGYAVPEKVAVIGYGINSRENEEEKRTSMIIFPMEEMARQTWLLMNWLISGKNPRKKTVICNAEVFYGKSCPEEWQKDP